MGHAIGQMFLALVLIGIPGLLLLGQVARIRESGRLGGMSVPPPARRAAGGKLGRLAMLAAHPADRKARADARVVWQKALAEDWREQRKYERAAAKQPGSITPAAISEPGGGVPKSMRKLVRAMTETPAARRARTSGNDATQPPAQAPATAAAAAQTASQPRGKTSTTPEPARAPQRPAPDPGGPTVPAGTSTMIAEQVIGGIEQIRAHAASGNIHAKREAIRATHECAIRFAELMNMLSRMLSEHGHYGHEITEPLATGGMHFTAGAMSISEGDNALMTLMTMTVADLAASPRRAPHHNELSETGAA